MDKTAVTLPRQPTKRPGRHIEQFDLQKVAQKIDVIVIWLRRDDFVDITPVPYPVKALSNGC